MLDVNTRRPPAGNASRRPAARFPAASRRARGAGPAACASTGRSTRTPSCIRWCAGSSRAGSPRISAARSCSPTWSTAAGRRYDIPVVVGALAASPRIYAVGMGRPVEEIEAAWLIAIAHPIPPVVVSSPACQQVVITGDDLRGPGRGLAALPVPVSTPGFDAAPYLTATLCVTRDPDTGIQNMGTYRGAAQSHRPARRAHGLAHRRRRRLPALAEAQEARHADAVRDRDRLRAGRDVHRRHEAADRSRRDGGGGRARRRADPHRQGGDRRSERAGRRRDRDRGTDRSRPARARGAVRRKPRPRRARRLQHVDAGDGDHPSSARRCSSRSSAR